MKDENLIQQKLYQHTLPVREGVWEAIEKQLPPKEENKKLPVFWLILFSSAMLGGALMFGFLKKENASPVQTDPVPSISIPSPTPSTPENQSDLTTAAKADVPGELNETKMIATHAANTEATFAEEAATNATTGNRISPSTSNTNSSSTSTSSSKSAAKNTIPATSKPSVSISSGTSTKNTTRSSAAKLANTLSSAIASEPVAEASVAYARSSSITTPLPSDQLQEFPGAERAEVEMSGIRPDPSCYKFSGAGGRYFFSADVFAGHGFSPRSFSDAGGESSLYTQARKSTERNQYAWAAGARFNMHLHNGFAIRLGFLYDQNGDIFDYTDTLATRSTTRVDSFFSADGTFLYADTNRVLIFGTLIKKIHNTYRHLDVPILASYEIPLGRSTLMFNVGPVFNLSSSYEGQILDPMLHPRYITPGQPGVLSAYKTSLGLSLYFGAGALVPLSEHFAAMIEPRYLYRIKPVTVKSYPVEEHRHFAGLNLGLRYFFQ